MQTVWGLRKHLDNSNMRVISIEGFAVHHSESIRILDEFVHPAMGVPINLEDYALNPEEN